MSPEGLTHRFECFVFMNKHIYTHYQKRNTKNYFRFAKAGL